MPSAKKPRAVRRTSILDIAPEEQIVGAPLLGKVKSYDAKRKAYSLPLEESLSVGDTVRVKGKETDLTQRVERLKVGGKTAQSALAGELVVLEAADRVRPGDAVYKVRGA